MTDRERLRGLAEAANSGLALRVETLAFRDAASPSVVLGLLGELEEAERAVRDTYLAINHKAVKTAEIRPIARLAAMLREQMDDMRYTDIVEVLQDFYAVAEAVGAVHEQSMGKPHPGTREEVVSAIESLRSRASAAESRIAELEAHINAAGDGTNLVELLDLYHTRMMEAQAQRDARPDIRTLPTEFVAGEWILSGQAEPDAVVTWASEPSPETGDVGWCWWAQGKMGSRRYYMDARNAAERALRSHAKGVDRV